MIELIKGETYEVLESLMMMTLKGKLIGIESSSLFMEDVKDVLIFEMLEGAGSYRYFGAKWELAGDDALNPNLRLRSCSYGNSPNELKKCGEYTPQKHIKIFAENET
jgi:hypothetical protein